jgi:hypothetical protein
MNKNPVKIYVKPAGEPAQVVELFNRENAREFLRLASLNGAEARILKGGAQ